MGTILAYTGALDAIPAGWFLCDGSNGTPDLRDRFIVGAGRTYYVGVTGGSKDAVVVEHTHTGTASSDGAHTHSIMGSRTGTGSYHNKLDASNSDLTSASTTGSSGAHTHELSISSAGTSGENANLPPYYALAFIMKL